MAQRADVEKGPTDFVVPSDAQAREHGQGQGQGHGETPGRPGRDQKGRRWRAELEHRYMGKGQGATQEVRQTDVHDGEGGH